MNKEEKYIDLILNHCINFDKSKSLFISYNSVNKDFINKLIEKVKLMGVNDIGLDEENNEEKMELLNKLDLEDIENNSYFNKSKWDEYAKKDAAFLMFETEFPHLFDDIDSKKVAKAHEVNRKTRPLFRKKEITYEIPWCIAALPNKIWADDLFNNDLNSYEKLENAIYDVCMINTENPIESWNNYLNNLDKLKNKLIDLKIKKMHYKNSLGTDLVVEMPNDAKWCCASDDKKMNMFVNLPSYEIFSSPFYTKTNGIVYNSKPLIYGGGKIDDFYLEFKDGKVVNFDAKEGYDILKSIINSDNNSCYLGEVALVNYDSPISNTNIVFGTTLLDENASCHLALGEGFGEIFEGGTKLSSDELLKRGVNQSQTHVDFMIGTKDLEITAECEDGEVIIFRNGNFNI